MKMTRFQIKEKKSPSQKYIPKTVVPIHIGYVQKETRTYGSESATGLPNIF